MYRKNYLEYPEVLLEGRVNVEGAVIGCLFKDPLLIDDTNLNNTYFASKDGLFYFTIIKELRSKNISSITEIDVVNNFNEKMIDNFEKLGGIKQVKLMSESVDVNNFETYLDELYKYKLDDFCKLTPKSCEE